MATGKKKKGGRGRRADRNRMAAPMREFVRVENPEGAEELGIVATFENNRYGVFLKKTLSDGFSVPGPDGSPEPMEVIHMIIVRHDKKKVEIPWAEKQKIKNELLGPMAEGVELFPSEMRRMDSIADHQTHLWILPPGATMPLGLVPKAMEEMARRSALEQFEVAEEELQVFQVDDDDVVQVFGTEEEAQAAYEENDNELSGGEVVRMDEVPFEGDGAVWSDLAKKKLSHVLGQAERLARLKGEFGQAVGDPVEARININGPETDQDELEEEYGVGDYAPNSDEEDVMMPEFMAMGVAQMKDERKLTVTAAVAKLAEYMEEQEQEEETEEEAAERAEREKKATEDLAKMREDLVVGQKDDGDQDAETEQG
jgi:hypothetical protein